MHFLGESAKNGQFIGKCKNGGSAMNFYFTVQYIINVSMALKNTGNIICSTKILTAVKILYFYILSWHLETCGVILINFSILLEVSFFN